MRKLTYLLSNGVTVYTKENADASGLDYQVVLKDIPATPTPLSPKQMEMRKKATLKH